MNESRWYTGRPAFASQLSAGPPRWISGTVAGTPASSAARRTCCSCSSEVPSGFSTTNGMRRSISARQTSAMRSCGPKTYASSTSGSSSNRRQSASTGQPHSSASSPHPVGVVVGDPDDVVHLGDRRGIQRDVPVRGAEDDGARAAHDDTAASADCANAAHVALRLSDRRGHPSTSRRTRAWMHESMLPAMQTGC